MNKIVIVHPKLKYLSLQEKILEATFGNNIAYLDNVIFWNIEL